MPMRLRAVVLFAALALTSTAAWPADEPTAPTREEEDLLYEVGRRLLKGREYESVCHVYKFFEVKPISADLLVRLRRNRPRLKNCNPDAEPLPLFLGPVQWITPHEEAVVHYATPGIFWPGYWVKRGRFGRWHFIEQINE